MTREERTLDLEAAIVSTNERVEWENVRAANAFPDRASLPDVRLIDIRSIPSALILWDKAARLVAGKVLAGCGPLPSQVTIPAPEVSSGGRLAFPGSRGRIVP